MNTQNETIDKKSDDLHMLFVINNQKYALPAEYIIEIIEMQPITQVPFINKYMKGIINLRSTIIPVMDARLRFGIEPIEYNERTCIIIIENDTQKIGLIVDAVNEVINISADDNMKMNSSKKELRDNFIKGISKVNNEIQLILDCDSLLKIAEDVSYEINE